MSKKNVAGRWHIIPEDVETDHTASPDCWCGPEEDELEPGLWIHNDMGDQPEDVDCEPINSRRVH